MSEKNEDKTNLSHHQEMAQEENDGRQIIRVPDGIFSRKINVITNTSQNLVVVLGKTESEKVVLVPYVEMACRVKTGIKEDSPEEPSFATISVENASFVISDVCTDFLRISQEVEKICTNRCGLDRASAQYIIDCLMNAFYSIEGSISCFNNIIARENIEGDDHDE